MAREWKKGDIVPLEGYGDIISQRRIEPVWHALLVPPQKDRATREFFKAKGVHAFYPEEWRTTFRNGKKHSRQAAIIPGIVYALFRHQPLWHVMRERRKLIRGVITHQGIPVEIHSDVIRRLRGLPVEAEAVQAAIAEMMKPKVGESYTVLSGPFEGFAAEICELEGKRGAWWVDIFGRKTRVEGDLKDLDFKPDEKQIAKVRKRVMAELEGQEGA